MGHSPLKKVVVNRQFEASWSSHPVGCLLQSTSCSSAYIIVWIYLLTKQQLRLVRRTLARGSCGEFSPKLLSRSLPRLVHDDHLRGKVMEFKEVYGSVGELRRSHRESVDGLTVLLSNCGYMWYIIILKLFQNCFSVLFPYNHVWNWNKIILAAETSSEIISATLNVFEDICELR